MGGPPWGPDQPRDTGMRAQTSALQGLPCVSGLPVSPLAQFLHVQMTQSCCFAHDTCEYVCAQTRITPKLSRSVWVPLAHSPCPARVKVLPVGILGDPATSPGSCSRERGLVTHQALLPSAGEPALPLFRAERQEIAYSSASSAAPRASLPFPKLRSRTSRLRTRRPGSPGARARGDAGPAALPSQIGPQDGGPLSGD